MPDFFFFFSIQPIKNVDILANIHLDFFHATDFGNSEHSKEKCYTQSGLSWNAISLGTGYTSYKQLGPIISSSFCKLSGAFMSVFK